MSLLQLQELASRQQQQIENTHRLLMNKEQRLNYLSSMQDSQQGPIIDFDHNLSHFKEKIALQEAKLRKLRLLKGQIQKQRCTNSNICSEVETIKLLHKEKERELSVALTKIDALTRQLDELQKGNTINSYSINGYKHATELEKLRQELLYKTKICKQGEEELAFKRNLLYKRQTDMLKIDQKINELQSRLARKRQLNQQFSSHVLRGPADTDSDLFAAKSYLRSSMGHSTFKAQVPYAKGGHVPLTNIATVEPLPRYKGNNMLYDYSQSIDYAVNKQDPKYQTLPYNTKFGARNANLSYTVPKQVEENSKGVSRNFAAMTDDCDSNVLNDASTNDISLIISAKNDSKDTSLEERPSPSGSSGSSDRISSSMTAYSFTSTDKMGLNGLSNDNHFFASQRREGLTEADLYSAHNQYVPNLSALAKGKETNASEDKANVALGSYFKTKPSVPVKPIAPNAEADTVDNCRYDANFLFAQRSLRSSSENSSLSTPSSGVYSSSEIFCQNGNSIEKDSNHGSMHEDLNTMDNFQNEQLEERSTVSEIVSKLNSWSVSNVSQDWEKTKRRPVVMSINDMETELTQDPLHCAKENLTDDSKIGTVDERPTDKTKSEQDLSNNNATESEETTQVMPTKKDNQTKSKRIKGSLKRHDPDRNSKIPLGRRVSFDPLALLLDASLEGELELVKKTSLEVPNPSASNDEGITALHNSTCAGHFDIVKYLVEIGCDVNVQDSDGWTPLHCAASCNNLVMIQFLVKSGACLFATTFSDHETAAEKCEEDEEGYDGCSQYLYGVQDQLGTANNGIVYALYDYESQNADELSFKEGDSIQVLRKADDHEKEWWWSKMADREGYIPRNLIGVCPRIKPCFKFASAQ